jgi:hypothetical protein
MSWLDEQIVKFDEATGFYDKAKVLDSHLKGEQVWNELLRSGGVIKNGVVSFATSPWKLLQAGVNPLKAFKDLGWDIIKDILFGDAGLADGTIPESEKKKPLTYVPPRPSSLDPTWHPEDGQLDPIRKTRKPPLKPKPRKLSPQNPTVGFRKTKKTEVITALESVRSAGDLICYPVRESGIIYQVPETLVETVGLSDALESKSLSQWLALQILPGDSAEKDAAKQELGYFNIAALAMPGSLKGLSGGVSLKAGVRGILAIAETMSARSVNAYIGFEPELYSVITTQYLPAGVNLKTEFEETPYVTGSVVQGEVTKSLMGIELLNKILDFDWGVKGTPEDILKGWGLMQFAPGGESKSFKESVLSAIKNGKINDLMSTVTSTTDGNKVAIDSLPQLLTHLASADYFRSGHHRYPQEVPHSLNRRTWEKDKPKLMEIGDAGHYQEWIADQLDALLGQWPAKVRIKTRDKAGNQVKGKDGKEGELVDLPNLAEGMAEMLTLLFNVNILTEHNHQMQIKSIIENFKDFNQNTMTYDHVVAISKFLGYHGETYTDKINIPFNPKAKSLLEFQKPSEQTQVRWKLTDALIVKEEMIKMAMNAAKAASAVWQKYKPGDKIPGERIKEEREAEQEKTDKAWEEFLKNQNAPTGYAKTDIIPNSTIGDRPMIVDKTKPRFKPPLIGELD